MVSGAQKDLEAEGLSYVWRATLLPAVPDSGDFISEPWLATTSDRLVAESKVTSCLNNSQVGLRAVLLRISTAGLRGMQLPARAVDEKEILCLPGLVLRVLEVLRHVVDGKEVPLLVVEVDNSGSTSHGHEDVATPGCSKCFQLGAHCLEHSDVCMGMQLEHGCHACGRKECWARNPDCDCKEGARPASSSLSEGPQGRMEEQVSCLMMAVPKHIGSGRSASAPDAAELTGRHESGSSVVTELSPDKPGSEVAPVDGRTIDSEVLGKRKLTDADAGEAPNAAPSMTRAKTRARTASRHSGTVNSSSTQIPGEALLSESTPNRQGPRRSERIMKARTHNGDSQDRGSRQSAGDTCAQARSID